MEPAFSPLEESFFAVGDAMSAIPEEILPDLSGIPEQILDGDTRPYERAAELASYYASLAIESDEASGGFEAAA